MGIKTFKPVTPTLRYRTVSDFSEIPKKEPEKSLLAPLKRRKLVGVFGKIGFDFFLRRKALCLRALFLFQISHERLRALGQTSAVGIKVGVKPDLPLALQRLVPGEDFGRGTDGGGGGQQLVHRRGQMRIMRHAVAQGLDRALQRGNPALPGGQRFGPAGITAGERLRAPRVLFRQIRRQRRFAQASQQGRLRPFGKRLRLHIERVGDVQQQLAADSAAVVFDQIEITGRDADLPGKVRLL